LLEDQETFKKEIQSEFYANNSKMEIEVEYLQQAVREL